MYFEETQPVYKVLNKVITSISEEKKGFYESIFNEEFLELEYEDQNLILGTIMGDFGLSFKDLIDYSIQEHADRLVTA